MDTYSDAELIFYSIATIILAVIMLGVSLGMLSFEQIRHAVGGFIEWFYSVF